MTLRTRKIWRALAAALLLMLVAAVLYLRPFASDAPLNLPPIDRIVVHKSARSLELWSGGRLAQTITGFAMGGAPVGQKQFEGDQHTPEGHYAIDFRNPQSSYHLSLRISYPDAAAWDYATSQGRSPGGEIYIHGQPNWLPLGTLRGDWTDGCIGLSNPQIEALWRAVPQGAVVEIQP